MQGKSKLTSPEIANLWTHYIRETLSICVNKYMLHTVQDPEIYSLFRRALQHSNTHIETLKTFFKKEKFPVPKGFTDGDVNLEAPILFTDVLCLKYLCMVSTHGHNEMSLAYTSSSRSDISSFYYQCNLDAMDIYKKSTDLLIKKQLFEHPPSYITPVRPKIIKSYSYVIDIFGKKRPMNSIEIGNTFFNLNKAMITKTLINGFKQVSKDKDVRKLLEKSIQTANSHITSFSNLLTKENFHVPKSVETEITDSTISPFSEKLMLLQTGFFYGVAVTYHNAALISSMRADISALNEKAALNSLWIFNRIGKEMIVNQWLEEPPQANDHKSLSG